MVTAWGTTSSALTQVILYYFNPRSRVGNDHRPLPGFLFCRNFNPRSRVGNDEVKEAIQTTSQISIHVPAWGTTPSIVHIVYDILFQSTFPRGERRRETKKAMFGWAFQSTFPRGERRNLVAVYLPDTISIHVPAWGTTA